MENSLFGSPWDDIIEDCCTDIRDADNEEVTSENGESKHAWIDLIYLVRKFVCALILFHPNRGYLPTNR